MSNPLVTINLVVLNGEKYLLHCLNALKRQTYHDLEINILDNGSKDKTKEITKKDFPEFNLVESEINYGMWGGQEKALEYSHGKYIIALSVDVLFAPDAVEKSVVVMEKDEKIGALQAKIYQYDINSIADQELKTTNPKIIDTVGFRVERSRRITNIGHGEPDNGQFDEEREVFGVEGAAPIFRREALEDSRIMGEIADHDMFWYADDIDLVWRMRLFGWKQVYSPAIVMYHDRSTTKNMSKIWTGYFKRIGERKKIPALKKRLDWRNKRLARLKNDHWINILKDLPWILKREIQELGYIILFEPSVLLEMPKLIRLAPKMLKKRKEIMARAKTSPKEIRQWIG
ncbi:MAG: glycosyltransferase family 2 protein [Candidatus Yanofskybacteria bacterium]|nr:glycosyltransferase family 2 protein [Candidatus Yanofskybacteria bacterium]